VRSGARSRDHKLPRKRDEDGLDSREVLRRGSAWRVVSLWGALAESSG